MKRVTVLTGMAFAGAAVVGAVAARGPLKAHLSEGTRPGRFGSWLNSYLNGPSYRLMAAALAPTPEDEVLDVACGWGEFLLSYANQARLVAGIDVSKKKVALARQRLAARIAGGTAEVVQGDAGTLPWVEATFTAVTCMDAFPFFSAPDRVVAEVFRVLRPGGRMLMQIGMRWPDGPPKHMPHPVSPLAGDEVASRRLVEDAGFREVTITYGRVGGENRLGNAVSRWTAGSDELRLVGAVKPG